MINKLYSTIIDALFDRADEMPDSLAYSVEGDSISYGLIKEEVLKIAENLAKKGLKKGDRCMVILPTGLNAIKLLYAVQILGAIPIMIDPNLPAQLIVKRMNIIGCYFVVISEDKRTDLNDFVKNKGKSFCVESEEDICHTVNQAPSFIRRSPLPEDIAFLQFSSGSTGEPKAIIINYNNLNAFLTSAISKFGGIRENDRFVTWVPLHHDLGLVRFIFGPLFWGCPSYLVKPSISNLRKWLKVISKVNGTITHSPDFGYRIAARMVNPKDVDIRSLRFAGTGGEPARYSTIKDFEKKFGLKDVIKPGYGLAEATLGVVCLSYGESLRVDSMGNPSCGRIYQNAIEAQAVGEDGKRADLGEPGEIRIRGPAVSCGYYNSNGAIKDIKRNGWFYTGDVGAMDADGHFYILGRKRALIKRGGALVIPREIEEIVDQNECIRLSAVIGCMNKSGSEGIVVIAEVRQNDKQLNKGPVEIAEEVAGDIKDGTSYMPNEIVLVSAHTIPRTLNGKIQYGILKDRYAKGTLSNYGNILYGKIIGNAV